MTRDEYERFVALRKRVMDAIKEELEIDCGCKSYEGTFELIATYPNYFDDESGAQGPEYYTIRLHCYVFGPARHYEWGGRTLGKALGKAEREIGLWLGEIGRKSDA